MCFIHDGFSRAANCSDQSHQSGGKTLTFVITVTLTSNEVIFQIMYDVFELRREFEARAGLDAGFGLCFVCLLS